MLWLSVLAGCGAPDGPEEVEARPRPPPATDTAGSPCCPDPPPAGGGAGGGAPSGGSTDAADCVPAVGVVLNEMSPANATAVQDIDGDSPDWVELTNVGPGPVDLAGWSLSDDPDEPGKWVFPSVVLDPGELLVVHASGKDRARVVGAWETRIDQGHRWRYLAVDGPVDPDWMAPEYDDSAWDTGPSGFGRGDSDDGTELDSDTVYVRTELELTAAEVADLVALALHVDFDDGFAAYLNGVEVARYALGLAGSGPPPWDAPAAWGNEAALPQDLSPRYFDLDGSLGLLHEGTNVLALEVHNASPESSDLSLVPFLSLGFATPGPGAPSPQLVLPTIDLHTSFALAAAGEAVRLYDPAGCEADVLLPVPLRADESYGRQPDGTGPLGYFLEPTPGAPNTTESRPGFVSTPALTPAPGAYPGGTTVTVLATKNARVHYAVGGWEPTEDGPAYTGPIHTGDAGEAVVLRVRAFEDGLWPSRIATGTYLVQEPGPLPVVSLVTDPPNLWDEETGIYVIGQGDPTYPHSGANFYEDWERPVHAALWEADGTLGFAVDGSIAIQGGNSRRHEQKNFEIQVSGGWGDDEIAYEVFPGLGIDVFSRLVLRAGGGDWLGCYAEGCMGGVMYRDRLMHDLTVGVDLDRMAARPVVVYLNGEYWGLYHLNEKSDGRYVEDHHGETDIDLLRNDSIPRQGDEMQYLEMMDWLRTHDLADPANYAHAETLMDVPELQHYLIFETFYANTDWPGNNIEFWRPRADGGRWRWLMFGTDFGLGMRADPEDDLLAVALAPDSDHWSNPPWSTELFRLLVQSPAFSEQFVNRYADLLNTLLAPERTRAANQALADEIAAEIPRHVARWGSFTDSSGTVELTGGEWAQGVAEIDAWLADRPEHARDHVAENFGLSGTWTLTLEADPPGAGTFELTAVTVEGPFTGEYFLGVPVTITAHPAFGYTFVGWDDPSVPDLPTVTVEPGGDLRLVARFD